MTAQDEPKFLVRSPNIRPEMSVDEAAQEWNRFMVDSFAQIGKTLDQQKAMIESSPRRKLWDRLRGKHGD